MEITTRISGPSHRDWRSRLACRAISARSQVVDPEGLVVLLFDLPFARGLDIPERARNIYCVGLSFDGELDVEATALLEAVACSICLDEPRS